MWHKPCRTFHPWCPCIKTRCLLWYSDAIWGHRSWSTLAQIMPWSVAWRHQTITWTSVDASMMYNDNHDNYMSTISQETPQPSITKFEICLSKISFKYPRGQWVNYSHNKRKEQQNHVHLMRQILYAKKVALTWIPCTPLGKSSRTFSCTCQIFKLIFFDCYKNLAYCNAINCVHFIQFLNFSVNSLRFSGH